MITKTYPWILIDKTNMTKFRWKFFDTESVAFAMMKSGTINYRNFHEFIIIKNESIVVDLAKKMEGIGGDSVSIHKKVKEFLNAA